MLAALLTETVAVRCVPGSAAEIAASLGVPRIRLDRLFAAELRRSAGKEILRQRLAKAKQLLTETDDTLDAIASSCGFCHASYLVNAFKKAFGTTPRRYRCGKKEPNLTTAGQCGPCGSRCG